MTPHEYVVSSWGPECVALIEEVRARLDESGYVKQFFSTSFRYWNCDEHRYWVMAGHDGVAILNRDLVIRDYSHRPGGETM